MPFPEEEDEDDDEGLSGGEIFGIVIAIVVVLVVVTLVIVSIIIWQSRRRKKYELATDQAMDNEYNRVSDITDTFQVAQPDPNSDHEKLVESHPVAMQSKEDAPPFTGLIASNEAAFEGEQREAEEEGEGEWGGEEDLTEQSPMLPRSNQDTHL